MTVMITHIPTHSFNRLTMYGFTLTLDFFASKHKISSLCAKFPILLYIKNNPIKLGHI